MSEPHWEIKIGQGLGQLYFGQARESAFAGAEPYGTWTEAPRTGSAEDIYATLLSALGEAEARAALEVLREEDVDLQPRRTFVFETGVHLTFLDDALDDILLDARARSAWLGDERPFALGPMPALRHLQTLNGTEPLMLQDDLYFAGIHATATQFLVEAGGGRLRPAAAGTDETQQKTLSWRTSPRDPSETFSTYRKVDLLGAR